MEKDKLIMVPKNPIPRYPCPFYAMGLLGFDAEGINKCALGLDHIPCFMRSQLEKTPDWKNCPFFNTPDNERLRAYERDLTFVLPREFMPGGIRLKDFMEYVLSEECPRPDEFDEILDHLR